MSSIDIQRTTTFNVINRSGQFLKRIGLNPFKVDLDKIIKKSKKKANFQGAIPTQVEKGLEQLIFSLNKDAKLNSFGELALKGLLERTLYGRLKIEQAFKANPKIAEIPIKRPIFIIGMPRTGTTILHALMHQDARHRSPLAWECLLPHPVPKLATHSDNPQLNTIKKEFGQLFKLVPDFQRKHYMEAASPQECLGINALDFNSFQTTAQAYIPSYMDWFNHESDQLETMRFHKRFLQYLSSEGALSTQWLLKSPVHLMRLNEIFEVYPDACIIMTHRTPVKVVPSASSLIASVRSLYSDEEDTQRTGAEQAKLWSDYFNRFLAARKSLDKESQILDLKFEDFIQDQLKMVEKIYDYFELELTTETVQKMKAFLAENPKDKHGAHHYTLQDFGLTEKVIEQQFHNYINFLETIK